MKLIIHNIKLSLDDNINSLKSVVSKKLRMAAREFKDFRIVKESIDARKKPDIAIIYSVMVEIPDKAKIINNNDVRIIEDTIEDKLTYGDRKLRQRPVVIGTGPAGLFAALVLSQNGYKPLVLERGECVEKRTEIVNNYWSGEALNTETNVQFGEGGAGTFSDGKLTTRINDRRCTKVIEEFYTHGAPEEILYKAKPHIGTDVLKKVVVNIRKRIIQLGGEVRFNSKVTSVRIKDGKTIGVVVNDSDAIDAEVVILATGHSARDTFSSLFESGLEFIPKPFSIGVRIEHSQQLINQAQYGEASAHPRLGAADYQLFYKAKDRTVYSFCMCPGGVVVASASEMHMIVTNGMSEYARDRQNANSALVVSVGPSDYGSSHPLAGIEFQRIWEKMAYKIGGSNGSAPVQRLEDFVLGRASVKVGTVKPSYTGQTSLADINLCLPDFVTAPMKESIKYFDDRLKGFGIKDALLTGVETRTSSPVRILRMENLEASKARGLYPTGEGAGYAGGIVSAAVDGIRVAEQIIKKYHPL
jgi:uncharacterized FAD-dependent dehydrogenase